MTKKELKDLGLTEEQITAVIKANENDVEVARSELKNLETENKGLKDQVKDRDTQLTTLKASTGDAEEMKKQIAELQEANETASKKHESEVMQIKLDHAVDNALTGAAAKNVKAVKALLDLDGAAFDKDGNIKGLSEQINKLKADEGSKFLFAEQQTQQPTFKGFQPGASTNVPEGAATEYSTRLAQARKDNKQVAIIQIKQEAAANGVILD